MRLLEQVDRIVVGRITFPAVNYILNRRDILGCYQKLLEAEHYKEDALVELQFQKLIAVLRHAHRWSPYYANKFKEIGCVPEDIKTLEDVKRIPPLNRQDVIEHHRDMVDARYCDSVSAAERAGRAPGFPLFFARFRRHRLVRNTSTGSTGTPTIFYEDGSTTALSWAHELRLKHWYGLPPGIKEARMARVSTEYLAKSKLLWAREHLWNQLILPGMNLSDHEYGLSLQKIRRFRPRALWGITTALTGLARYIQHVNEDVSSWHLGLVVSWAAPLYEHEKKLLSEVFGCPVTNIYGSRELGHVASACPHGSLHVNQEDFLVEIEGYGIGEQSVGPGEILITRLNESPMPFLRYRIGDLGEMTRRTCPCGRSLRVLKNILGRIGEVFVTTAGRMIAPNFWCRMFMLGRQSQNVEKFQVVYRSNGSIRFRIVRRPGYSAETEADLRRFLEKNVQSNLDFEFEYVSDIRPHPSGKYEMVVKETDQYERNTQCRL